MLGAMDDGTIDKGVNPKSIDQMCKNLANMSNNGQVLKPSFLLQPEIVSIPSNTTDELVQVIVLQVPSSSQVHRFKGKVFDRSVDGDFELRTDAEISALYLRKSTQYKNDLSIDEPLNIDWDGNELLLSDVLGTEEDTVMRPIEEDVERSLLAAAINTLSPREKEIITLRFGLGGIREQTQKEVAELLGIPLSTPMMMCREIVYDHADEPIHRTKQYLLGDRFKYVIPKK